MMQHIQATLPTIWLHLLNWNKQWIKQNLFHYSKSEQLSKVKNLHKQLSMKKNLISRYKGLNLKVNGLSAAAAAASTTRPNQN